jgi:hypothetical protein
MECRVVVYGTSLFMAVIETVLKDQPGFRVIRIDPAQVDASLSLDALDAEVVLLDDTTCTSVIATNSLAFTAARPTTWLSIPASANPVVAVLIQRHSIRNVDELVELVRLSQRL